MKAYVNSLRTSIARNKKKRKVQMSASTDKKAKASELRVNREINLLGEYRVIASDGTQLGIMSGDDALLEAQETGLDLVEISPNSNPPVCRIMDYSKYKYNKQKQEKRNKKNTAKNQIKEMKFRCNIGDSDYETKKRHIMRFIDSGNKVKITIMFRGREMRRPDTGLKILERLSDDLSETASVVSQPKLEGRNMTMVIAPYIKSAR